MQNETTKNKAPKSNRKPAGKPTIKAKPEAKAAKAPAVNVHIEAGINVAAYTGLSSFVNKNRKPQIATDVTRNVSQLTTRMQKCFYAMRDVYGSKAFAPRGIDNRILADLAAAGLISHKAKSGQTQNVNGTSYLTDGATPLAFNITAAGTKYGKA